MLFFTGIVKTHILKMKRLPLKTLKNGVPSAKHVLLMGTVKNRKCLGLTGGILRLQ